jgi:hypothetical protein
VGRTYPDHYSFIVSISALSPAASGAHLYLLLVRFLRFVVDVVVLEALQVGLNALPSSIVLGLRPMW